MTHLPTWALALALSIVAPAQASDVEARAERLAQLRTEVERLSNELELDKDDLRGRLRALEQQKVELEAQIRREEIRLERLLIEEQEQVELLAKEEADADMTAAVREGIAALRDTVRVSLPFRKEERLTALEQLETQLRDGTLTAETVSARLWAFAEDERRLTRENALDRQVIAIDGGEVLVDVARLGMVALYYRTPDGAYGRAARRGGDWAWEPLDGSGEIAQLEALYDALGKGIRVGAFTLPHLVPEGG